MAVPTYLRWAFGLALAAFIFIVPVLHYRAVYDHSRRLREVEPGILYRSGSMTAVGFADAVNKLGIKTIVNLQDEYPDPPVRKSYFNTGSMPETELCQRLGVRYIYLTPDLVARQKTGSEWPKAIDDFLAIMDDPANHPVLIHCKAGLHRTGVMVAVYRMEYDGWSPQAALKEVKANGFGEFAGTSANEYIAQYITTYIPRHTSEPRSPQSRPLPSAMPGGVDTAPPASAPPGREGIKRRRP